MFTGIVEELGEVASFEDARLAISASAVLPGMNVSDSICVSGACLTVVEMGVGQFSVEVVPETVRRTNFGALAAGSPVNLERPLEYGGRVGGHFVQGHVDGVASIDSVTQDGNSVRICVKAGNHIMRYVVEKGFIALDGISLTVAEVDADGFSIAIIPFTRENTTLRTRQPGDTLNVEVDVTAKYVERFTLPHLPADEPGGSAP